MLRSLPTLALLVFMSQTAFAAIDRVITKEAQAAKTPAIVLQKLKEGNQRFVAGEMHLRNFRAQALKTAESQHPMAVILSCIDSRSAPEVLFDQGIGDVFVTRTAGNVVNADILGGLEFATKVSGAKLILVLAHSNCGAIKGACADVKLGNLTQLLEKIQPAVNEVAKTSGSKDCNNIEFIDQVAEKNVKRMIQTIKNDSPVIAKLIENKDVEIIGAIQDLKTGKVTFLGG